MKCHCGTPLTPHDGLGHCAACGCYYRGKSLDPNHTPCRDAERAEAPKAAPESPSPPAAAEARTVDPAVVHGGKDANTGPEIPPEDSPAPESRTRRKS